MLVFLLQTLAVNELRLDIDLRLVGSRFLAHMLAQRAVADQLHASTLDVAAQLAADAGLVVGDSAGPARRDRAQLGRIVGGMHDQDRQARL